MTRVILDFDQDTFQVAMQSTSQNADVVLSILEIARDEIQSRKNAARMAQQLQIAPGNLLDFLKRPQG
jgi:hypothetical protein